MERNALRDDVVAAGIEEIDELLEDDFESLYDAPMVALVRTGALYMGEVTFSGSEALDATRTHKLLATARAKGLTPYGRQHGEFGSLLIYFEKQHAEEYDI